MNCRRTLTFLLLGAFVALTPPSRAQTLSTIFTNGPTSKRINIVLLSEGYQAAELGQFLTHAAGVVRDLLSVQPYSEYSNYFNAFAISVASTNSGSDHPPGTFKNTYFNSSYNLAPLDQLITIPPDNFDANFNDGKGKVLNLLTNLIPDYDIAILVVNDTTAGGSGEHGLAANLPLAITSRAFGVSETVAHEIAHTLGGLADEYDSAYPGFIPLEKPNSTTQTNRALIKWTAWIDGSTPIPTPENASYYDSVGLFEGSQYQTTNWYRPKLDCKMNHLFVPFCEVCSEQLVKSIYSLVRPIDTFSPAATNFTIVNTQAVAFSVTQLQPLSHSLAVQWYTNGVPVNGATNISFQLLPGPIGNGMYTIKAAVTDPTTLVRNDPASLLKATNTWNMTVSLNELSLVAAQYLPGSQFRFTVTGAAPQGFVIQASTNLYQWTPLSTNSLVSGRFDYTNPAGSILARFYRTLSPP